MKTRTIVLIACAPVGALAGLSALINWANNAPAGAPDLVGAVLPAYLGAIGSIAAASVATIALLREIGLRRSTVAIANLPPITSDVLMSNPSRTPVGGSPAIAATKRGAQTVLTNETIEELTLETISVVTIPFDVSLSRNLPVTLQPGEGFGLVGHHIMGGPAIAIIEVRYSTPTTIGLTTRVAV